MTMTISATRYAFQMVGRFGVPLAERNAAFWAVCIQIWGCATERGEHE